jgi:hypothetical protein
MTTFEMDAEALRMGGWEVTDANRTKYYQTFLRGYNAGQADVYANVLDLAKWKSTALDSNKKFLTTSLDSATEWAKDILKISLTQDYIGSSLEANPLVWDYESPTSVVVPDATASGTVYVKYRILPVDLLHPTATNSTGATSPTAILAPFQDALIYKAISRGKAQDGLLADATYWEQAYKQAVYNIKPAKPQKKVRDVNGY